MLYICNVQFIKTCVLVFYKLDGWHQVHSINFLRVFAKRNLLAFGGKICGLKLKHCLKDLSIKLIHFYQRCVSRTVVQLRHFLRAKVGSHKSQFLLRAEEGRLKLQLLSDFLSFQMKQICIIKNAMVYMWTKRIWSPIIYNLKKVVVLAPLTAFRL